MESVRPSVMPSLGSSDVERDRVMMCDKSPRGPKKSASTRLCAAKVRFRRASKKIHLPRKRSPFTTCCEGKTSDGTSFGPTLPSLFPSHQLPQPPPPSTLARSPFYPSFLLPKQAHARIRTDTHPQAFTLISWASCNPCNVLRHTSSLPRSRGLKHITREKQSENLTAQRASIVAGCWHALDKAAKVIGSFKMSSAPGA